MIFFLLQRMTLNPDGFDKSGFIVTEGYVVLVSHSSVDNLDIKLMVLLKS